MTDVDGSSPMFRAVVLNARRRAEYYAKFRAAGAAWLLECRDLWDSEDDDAGVYFTDCSSERGVDTCIRELDPLTDRVLGIYDLSKPLDEQGVGLTLEEWQARRKKPGR
ncbi:MAG: hypothetical protein JXB04_11675 [Kiritimatiellae bacterium]|nr:hypothetical protein [Kiritimatiellia bacterium]